MLGAGAWPNATLRGVGVVVPSIGITKVWEIPASFFRDAAWLLLIGSTVDSGCRCCNKWIDYWVAVIASSAEEVFGRATWVGNHTNVMEIPSAEFSLMWVW